MHFRIQINAQKFQQGRLIGTYFPQSRQFPDRYFRALSHLSYRTQLPRVEVDCSTIQEAEIKIPFISPTSYFNLVTGEGGDIGQFDLGVYSPLIAPTGSNVVDYSVWCYWTDVTLEFPTYQAFMNFGGHETTKKINIKKNPQKILKREILNNLMEEQMDFNDVHDEQNNFRTYRFDVPHRGDYEAPWEWLARKGRRLGDTRGLGFNHFYRYFDDDELEPQVGWSARDAGVSNEESIFSKKPISTGLGILGGLATAASFIPAISWFAKPASYVLAGLSKCAWALGWSKPLITSTASRYSRYVMDKMNNYDGTDNCVNLGLSQDNHITPMPGHSGQDIDELHFNYLKIIPMYVHQFTWLTNQASGTMLHAHYMSPLNSRSTFTYGSTVVNVLAPFAYIANLFRYWRGSLVLNFKVIKTQFHSGRLALTYYPGHFNPAVYTEATSAQCYREVIDLQEANEFTITVPYVSVKPWLETNVTMNYLSCTGLIAISVLNPLVCPATVSNSVSVIVEVCAGKDFEVACPVQPYYFPVEMITEEEGLVGIEDGGELIEPQMDFGTDAVEEPKSSNLQTKSDTIGGSTVNKPSADAHQFCIGEVVCSARQLIKRATLFLNPSTWVTPTNFGVEIMPRSMTTATMNLSGLTLYGDKIDYLTYFSTLYLYNRGSVRLRVVRQGSPGSPTRNMSVSYRFDSTSVDTIKDVAAIKTEMMEAVPFTYMASRGAEVQVPFYSNMPIQQNYNVTRRAVVIDQQFLDNIVVRVEFGQNLSTEPNVQVARSAGDDFDFGFFIGTPPCVVNTDYTATAPIFGSIA